MCRPGYRYPFYQHGPFQGGDIESATGEEYDSGFNCLIVKCELEKSTLRSMAFNHGA